MRFLVIYLFASLIFPFRSYSQLWPADSTVLNYRIIGFSFPADNNANNYKIEIAKGNYASPAAFEKSITVTAYGKMNRIIAEVPSFSSGYSWRVVYLQNQKIVSNGPMHHFSTGISSFIDTGKTRMNVTQPPEKYKDGYVFLDANRALYDMDGQPVWYLPPLAGVLRENAVVRDLKLSCKGTITFLLEGDIYEINYNGDILWRGPNGSKLKGDTMQCYHHEITRLANGHYMALGFEAIVKRKNPAMRDTALRGPLADTAAINRARASMRKPRYGNLEEYDGKGTLVWSWDAGKYYSKIDLSHYSKPNGTPENDIHENSFFFDEENSIIYLSFRNISQILKISYPSGEVLNAYSGISQGDGQTGNNLFCGQHACKLSSSGLLYMFDNGCNFTEPPKVLMLKEPISEKDTLQKIWEYPCPVDTMEKKMIPRRMQFSTGGNVMELPDHSIFASTCSPYNKIFIVSMAKEILWSASPERWDAAKNEWQPLPLYRASIIPDQKKLDELIWHSSPN